MKWFRDLLARIQPVEPYQRGGVFYGSAAGMVVNADAALSHAAVWSCIRIISESIATLGWHILQNKRDGTRERVYNDKLDWLLNAQPNPEMTAFTWRETMLMHALLQGNHVSEIVRDGGGRPIEIWPIDPLRNLVEIRRRPGGALFYRVTPEMGKSVELEPSSVFHCHGLGSDAIWGMSVLSLARRSLGGSLALDAFAGNFFANGAHVGTMLKHPGKLSQSAKDYLKQSMDDAHAGPANAFKSIVLEEGMDVVKASMSMQDAQFLESRKFDVLEICRWFRVPPHKVADLERSTFSNIEHQAIEFVTDTLLPWCRRLEQEADIKLVGAGLQGFKGTRLNIDTLLRGDIATRYVAYEKGRTGGWLSANDVRRLEQMNPIPNGDIYLQPMNYLEAGKEPPAPKPAPAIAAPTPDAPKPGEDTQALLFDPQQFSPTDFVCATPPRKRAKRKPNGHATP